MQDFFSHTAITARKLFIQKYPPLYSQIVLLIEHLLLQSVSYCSTFGMYMDSVDTYYY